MVEIIKNANDTITFVCDGYILPCSLVKVEKVADNSNYYCLWVNEKEFYLFNVENKKHALKINTYTTAFKFCKIEFYSNNSKSFIAYRSDKNYAYILFENGDYEKNVFKYVGNEYNGIRPVKAHNDKWGYYNVFKKNFIYDINKGMFLEEDEELVQCYNTNCYTIYKKGLYYRFVLFDTNAHKTYYSDKIEHLEETDDDNKIIGKIYGKTIYTLLNKKNPTLPIGYYTSKPRYIAEKNCFIAKKINSFVVISNNKEISNCQWVEDAFIFHDNYILNRTTTGIWKLYRFSNGSEICTDWTNIRFDSECIIADTEKGKNQKVGNSDIDKFSQLLIEKSKSCFECLETKVIQANSNETERQSERQNEHQSEHIDNIRVEDKDKDNGKDKDFVPNNYLYNELPQFIDYLAFTEHVKISENGYIQTSRVHKVLSANNYICWIIYDKHAVAISKFLNTKVHKVVYYKENVDPGIFNEKLSLKNFIKISIATNKEETLFEELAKCCNESFFCKSSSDNLPCNIDCCIFINELYANKGDMFEYIQPWEKENIHENAYVCWAIKKERIIMVSEYLGYNQHRVVFKQKNNYHLRFPKHDYNRIIKININVTTKTTLVSSLSKLISSLNNIATSLNKLASSHSETSSIQTSKKIVAEDKGGDRENIVEMEARLQKLYQTKSNLEELGLKINDDIITEIKKIEEYLGR